MECINRYLKHFKNSNNCHFFVLGNTCKERFNNKHV